VLKALIGYREKIYLVQAVAYLLFMFTIGGLYFNSLAVPTGASVQRENRQAGSNLEANLDGCVS
jgi:high-affinity iron transporter